MISQKMGLLMKTEWQNWQSKATKTALRQQGGKELKHIQNGGILSLGEQFFNHKGKCFASLCGAILKKSEREEDRLRMTGGRAYAIDVDVLRKAHSKGAKFLEIHEKTVTKTKRVFQIPIIDIFRYGREIDIRGIARCTIPLEACELKQGSDEPWRVEAREALLKGEDSNTRSQLPLFGA